MGARTSVGAGRSVSRLTHAEDQVRLVLVVAPATERDVLDGGRSSLRVGLQVVELQEGPLRAPPSVGGHEATLPAVTVPDRALHVSRGIARSEHAFPGLLIRPVTDRVRRPRLRGCSPLRLLDFLEQKGDRAVEDRGRITVRDLAAEKGLKTPQLVVAFLADRELDAIALGRGGLDDRTTRRR